jgi:hypothetical protein
MQPMIITAIGRTCKLGSIWQHGLYGSLTMLTDRENAQDYSAAFTAPFGRPRKASNAAISRLSPA